MSTKWGHNQLIDRLKELRESRGKNCEAIANFLVNFGKCAALIHKCLPIVGKDQTLIDQLKRSYVVSLVSILETFYRDLLVQTCNDEPELLKDALLHAKKKPKPIPEEVNSSQEFEINAPEWLVLYLNLQNLDQIKYAMNPLSPGGNYFDALDFYEGTWCVLKKSPENKAHIEFPNGWRNDFKELFHERHRYVHDGNSPCTMSNDRMALMEFLVLLIAQTTAMLLKIKFRKGGVFMSSLGVPAFWTVDALISDDWVALDDEPGGSGEADSNVENKDCRAPAVWYEI